MKRLIIAAVFAVASMPLAAQNIEMVIRGIEQNNTTLRALADQTEADRLALRTGIRMQDPQVEFARLWGAPATIGNRTDIAVSQGFDIATVSGMKARQARRRGELIDLGFASERTNILLEAKQYCIELIYCNRLAMELEVRLQHARMLADGYERKLADGDANRLELGKAQLNLSTVRSEIARNEIERDAIRSELQRLNGGVAITLDAVCFAPVALPVDFEEWWADASRRSPALEYVRREVETSRREVSLAHVEGLPQFSIGYMREKTLGQHYQGVTAGMSIPLWANRNRVRQAKAAHAASLARLEDSTAQFYAGLRNLYARAAGLGAVVAESHRILAGSMNAGLLKKALDAGEISLLDYIVEMGLYYDTQTRALEAERDFQLAHAALTAVEL